MQIHCPVSFVCGILKDLSLLYLFHLCRNNVKIVQTVDRGIYIYFTVKTTSMASILGNWLSGMCPAPDGGVTAQWCYLQVILILWPIVGSFSFQIYT